MSPDTRTCPVCWGDFTASPRATRHTYCSDRCRAEAGRRRRKNHTTQPAADPPANLQELPQPAAIRDCPHCGRAVTIVALLTTVEAARPQLPIAAPDVVPLRRP
jgi:endogenous inhibitor of DNA gyrase (YacG/DUF329 family)